MKVFIYFLSFLSVALIIYNSFKLDFNDLFLGDSFYAIVTILSASCALILLQILRISKEIEKYQK